MIFKDKTSKALGMIDKMVGVLKEGIEECKDKQTLIKDQQVTLAIRMLNVKEEEKRMKAFLSSIPSKQADKS